MSPRIPALIFVTLVAAIGSVFVGNPLKLDPARSGIAEAMRSLGFINAGDDDPAGLFNGRQALVLLKAKSDDVYRCAIMKAVLGTRFECNGRPSVQENWTDWISIASAFQPRSTLERDSKLVTLSFLATNLKAAEKASEIISKDRGQGFETAAPPTINEAPLPDETVLTQQNSEAEDAERKRAEQDALDADYFEARSQKACDPSIQFSRQIGNTGVVCGCSYQFSAHSVDGRRVCAGGEYQFSAQSRDGTDVACGGRYQFSATSRDGRKVCAGGEYQFSAHSTDGTDVACGGRYQFSDTSRDGRLKCYGGLYGQ